MTTSCNKFSNEKLKTHILSKTELRITISFYKYFSIKNPEEIRNLLYKVFRELNIFGRIYLAHEGINAQISIPKKNVETLRSFLHNFDSTFSTLRFNIALDNDRNSFYDLRMKVKNRIVADGIIDPTFNIKNVGKYLKPKDVNSMFEDPNTVFVDIRNYYEYEIGHFKNALEIPSSTFREQLLKIVKMMQKFKNKKIIMYCTSGIRCEKASAWMKHNGFKKVWQIEDGIIGYVRFSRENGLPIHFIGRNFVFDSRMSEKVSDDVISYCYQCNTPYDIHRNCRNNNCHLLFIQCRSCAQKFDGCCSKLCSIRYKSSKL